MSPPASAKRRRVDDVKGKITKPFVSPLRTPKPAKAPLSERNTNSSLTTHPYLPSVHAHTIKAVENDVKPLHAGVKPAMLSARCTPVRRPFPSLASSKQRASPEEVSLQKEIAALERQIRQINSEMDALKQAEQITASTADADLEALSDKWRAVSQTVAEELFGSVKERVYRMGGVAAWRDGEKRKHERAYGIGEFAQEEEAEDDDADCEFDSDGEELPLKEQEYRKKMKRQAKQEMIEASDPPEQADVCSTLEAQKPRVWVDQGKDDDTFTMDMMLQSLNIPLELIGYDKDQQRWTS